MPDVLDELPEWARTGRREKYPYDRWFDGKVWLLHEGVDFEQDRRGMANRIRHAAKKRGVRRQRWTRRDRRQGFGPRRTVVRGGRMSTIADVKEHQDA